MDKNKFALTPPMGWNSYDYYDTSVNEEQVKANAIYMAENLKEFGWEYIVIDIEWYGYDTGSQREKYQYIPFWKVEMDEYSRLLPCVQKFPSAKDGKGFQPLAEFVHNLGLKFGIHIMRGIPRNAAHAHTKILGTDKTANEVADPSNICDWNPDMYGIRPDVEGAQEYYDSIFKLYAEWGVDFVKCDDICRMDMPTAKKEIEMLYQAIQKCGRPIVLSLSPGPARIEEAWHYETYANMWRITDDFWDKWDLLLPMFERCELWQSHVREGCFPDCDMLTVGRLGKGFGNEWQCNFTREEQVTMLTLWCIFRSPLMIGTDLTTLDDWTKKLLTNQEVLGLLSHSAGARQIKRDERSVVWCSEDTVENAGYIAVFNLEDKEAAVSVPWEAVSQYGICRKDGKELWSGETAELQNMDFVTVPAHGAKLYKVIM
ncbi:glycoside hydrolase family 27 protein [bacterium D16-51]|nr:glycoside hydrolase family 27 protein [bacterium D16-59]RKI60245.1 glycoside hydrolase family 27 protein [bacterium D16-51]